jgi:hypothetical protein
VAYDPKRPDKIITQCFRVSEHVYYLTGPGFNDFTPLLVFPGIGPLGTWELEKLFEAGRDENTTEAEMVDLINLFIKDHGAHRDDMVFTCRTVPDVLETLAGLFAAYSLPSKG